MSFMIDVICDPESVHVWERTSSQVSEIGEGTINGKEFLFYAEQEGKRGICFGRKEGELLSHLFCEARKREKKIPILYFLNCYGADLKEKTAALDSYANVFKEFVACGEDQLQIAVIVGNCVGGSAYLAAMCDIILFSEPDGNLCLTGPKIVQSFMGENCRKEELGGVEIHSANGTIAHTFCGSRDCAEKLDILLSAYYQIDQPEKAPAYQLENSIVPMSNKAYDIHRIIDGLIDSGTWLETAPGYAPNLVTGFARIGGMNVGIFANQPQALAGTIDCDASEKGERFLKNCKKLRLPLLVISDVPSFMPGIEQERNSIEIKGAGLLKAMIRLDTVKLTLILHKSFGGAYIVMNSVRLGADRVYAWPGSTIGIMGEGMARALSKNPNSWNENMGLSAEENLNNKSLSGIIFPEETRYTLISDFRNLKNRKN